MVSKKLYHEYKNAGKCVMCGNERGESTSSVRCQACHDKFNESRFKRLNKRKEAALCLQCGANPSVGNSNYCIECRRKNADIKRKLSDKKIIAYKDNNICRICNGPVDAFRVICAVCLKKASFTKLDAIKRYGNKCIMCNSDELDQLCLVSEDISKPLKNTGKSLYKIICYSSKPPAIYRILCSKCYWKENISYIKNACDFFEMPKYYAQDETAKNQDEDVIDVSYDIE